MDFDSALLDILISSQCPQGLFIRFTGLRKEQLMNMPLPILNGKLRETLPLGLENRSSLIRNIVNELQKVAEVNVEEDEQREQAYQPDPPNFEQPVSIGILKQEINEQEQEDQLDSVLSPGVKASKDTEAGEEDDDEVEFIGEVMNSEVSFVGLKQKTQEEVSLLDDENLEERNESGNASNLEADMSVGMPSSLPVPTCSSSRKRKKDEYVHIRLSAQFLQRKRQGSNKKGKIHVQPDKDVIDTCGWDWVNISQLQTGKIKVYSLECKDWVWDLPSRQHTLLNLIKPGAPCSGITELSIQNNGFHVPESLFPLDLPYLTHLKARQEGNIQINYKPLLLRIMQTSKLEAIEFSSEDEIGLGGFLSILADCSPHLGSLKTLSFDQDNVALTTEIAELSQIKLDGLEELNLHYSIWADAKLEPLLLNFAQSLKKLTVDGCYTTDAAVEPQILINIPHMPYLEVLDLGRGQQFESNFETTDKRPPKRRSRTFRIEPQQDSNGGSTTPNLTEYTRDDDSPTGYMFRVTLNFPALPKLKTLILSSLYSVQGFHFSLFPALEVFRVASDWHLSIPNKPVPVNERKVYAQLKEFQFPDLLADHTFMSKIPVYFPNVEKLVLNLPSVKVLRSLAKIMKNVKSFKHLEVKTQFDFQSSLDYCFLANSAKVKQTEEEIGKIQIMKEYPHHLDYVTEYHVEIPSFDADGAEFEGLGAMKKKFRTIGGNGPNFIWHHIPRMLRLPKGQYHWNDNRCEFTDTLIGYKKIPISNEAWNLVPWGFRHWYFEDSKLTGNHSLYDKREAGLFQVTLNTSPLVKKNEA